MKQKYNHQCGFTLLEMMIVIAIIGSLMTLAIPSYQRYIQRAKFTEIIQAVGPYKIGVTLCAYQQGDLQSCSTPGQNNIPTELQNTNPKAGYVKSITVGAEGTITVISQRIKLDKQTTFTYTLRPSMQPNGTVQWIIDNTAPNSCKRYHLC